MIQLVLITVFSVWAGMDLLTIPELIAADFVIILYAALKGGRSWVR